MYPEFQLREENFVVLDVQPDRILAGHADPTKPPPMSVDTKVCVDAGGEMICGSELEERLAGDEATTFLDRSPFTEDGRVRDWTAVEALCTQALFRAQKIQRARNHSPVLVSIPSHWSRSDREALAQMFFEKFNVPGLYIADRSLMTMYGYGQHLTGVVVHISREFTEITPIVETVVQYQAYKQIPIGGKHILQAVRKELDHDTQFKREYGQAIDDDTVRYIFENVCDISAVPLESETGKGKKEKDSGRTTVTTEERRFSVGDARHKPMEILFAPKMTGKWSLGLADAIVDALWKCDLEKRTVLVENIMITGSFCELKGLQQRLEKDIKKQLPVTDFISEHQPREVRFGRMPEYIEKMKGKTEYASWLGGSIAAKMIFPDMKNYITKLDYNESGPGTVHLKGY